MRLELEDGSGMAIRSVVKYDFLLNVISVTLWLIWTSSCYRYSVCLHLHLHLLSQQELPVFTGYHATCNEQCGLHACTISCCVNMWSHTTISFWNSSSRYVLQALILMSFWMPSWKDLELNTGFSLVLLQCRPQLVLIVTLIFLWWKVLWISYLLY